MSVASCLILNHTAPLLPFPAHTGGWAMIYDAGLIYSMEVGSSNVKAGAFFEFFLAIGNASGPLLGLVPRLLSDVAAVIDRSLADPLTLILGAIVVALFVAFAFGKAALLRRAPHAGLSPTTAPSPIADGAAI